jgi:hypothetical protein
MDEPLHRLRFYEAYNTFTWPPLNLPTGHNGTYNCNWSLDDARNPLRICDVQDTEVVALIGALLTNIDRVLCMLQVPSHLIDQGRRSEVMLRAIALEESGSWEIRLEHHHAIKAKYIEQRDTMWHPRPGMPDTNPINQGIDEVDRISETHVGAPRCGLEAILRGALIGTWTAFESFAVDLWVTCVNLRPRSLARNVIELKSTAKERSGTNSGESFVEVKMNQPRIGLDELARFGFNVSNKMGQLLKDERRVSLESLSGISTAYRDAFRQMENKKKPPSPKLETFFSSVYGDLKCLEALRNLLAHRGGIVDEKFLDEVKPYSEFLHSHPRNRPLIVDGPLVKKYLFAVGKATVDLLNLVCEWLDKHKE